MQLHVNIRWKIEEERFCFISNAFFYLQYTVQCYRLIQLRSVSMRTIEVRDRYMVNVITYIGERLTSQTDEINWRFQ